MLESHKVWSTHLVDVLSTGSDPELFYARVCDDLYVTHCCADDPLPAVIRDLILFTDSLMVVAFKRDMREYGGGHASNTLDFIDCMLKYTYDRLINQYGYTSADIFIAIAKFRYSVEMPAKELIDAAPYN